MFKKRVCLVVAVAGLLVLGCTKEELKTHLQARLANGELGGVQCAALSSNFRPVDQGFDDIRYDWIPGAHRAVLAKGGNGWRMTWGAPELALFTQAGFFTMMETTIASPDGAVQPAREYRLTKKGYEAMTQSGRPCFEYQSLGSVEIAAVTEIPVPERLSGIGRAFRVKYQLRPAEVARWADTPEFRYVYSKIYTAPNPGAQALESERVFFYGNGRWLDEREAMTELAFDAASIRLPEARGRLEQERQKNAGNTPEKKAARIGGLRSEMLISKVADEKQRRQLAPCFELPVREADLTRGIWKKDGPPAFVFYDEPTARHDKSRRDNALELLRRMEKAGLARATAFDQEPFPGARKGRGTSYSLDEAIASALDAQRAHCLPLGDSKIESIRIVKAADGQDVGLRGWAQVINPRSWTGALAAQFPSVRALLEHGYGVSGTIRFSGEQEVLQVQAEFPKFALKSPGRPVQLQGIPATIDGPAIVDHSSDGSIRMSLQGCNISADGTEVSAGAVSCGGARSTRGFRRGKAYAEITFRAKVKGGNPDTWTNAAVTSARHLSSVSTGSALFSFAGTYTKNQIKDGDTIGIALDMDEQLLYWHLNGEWRTGRPDSGIGEPMVHVGQEYFIAVSVQDKGEAWRINFGSTPFRFPRPDNFQPYGASALPR